MHTGTHAGMLTEMGMLTGTRAEMGTGTHGQACTQENVEVCIAIIIK